MIISLKNQDRNRRLTLLSILKSKTFIFSSVFLVNVLLTFVLSKGYESIGVLLITFLVALPILIIGFLNPVAGFYISFFYASFMFFQGRILDYVIGFVAFPMGTIVELLLLNSLFGALIKNRDQKRLDIRIYRNPIFYAFISWIIYVCLQFLNPYAHNLLGWILELRKVFQFLVIYILVDFVIHERKDLRQFTKIWLLVVALAALYGVYQEVFGLPPWDLNWVTATEERINLNFIQGRWRKFSFMSDTTAFGQFMALGTITLLLVVSGKFSTKTKISGVILLVPVLLSLGYSATRTAFAMVPIGLFIYGLLTIDKLRTIVFSLLAFLIFLFILFGPISGGMVSRIRSTFKPDEDPSMQVRSFNRKRIQPYILSHPIGGGLNTTGAIGETISPGHFLAGFPPDSGYLKVATEAGWIGLFLIAGLFATNVIVAIKNYQKIIDENLKSIFVIYLSIFYAFTIAYYAQHSMFQLPYNYILLSAMVLFNKIYFLDENQQSNIKV